MGYQSTSGFFWTVNKQASGEYQVIARESGKGGSIVKKDRTYPKDSAAAAGARAAKLAYQQGREDAKAAIKNIVAST